MTSKTYCKLLAAAAVSLVTVSATFADTTVSRCDFKAQGNLFVPGLRVCSPGKITDIKIGENGLTREIFFNDKALMEYAKAQFDLSPSDVAAGVCNRCDSMEDGEDGVAEAQNYEPPNTDDPTDPDTPNNDQNRDRDQDQDQDQGDG